MQQNQFNTNIFVNKYPQQFISWLQRTIRTLHAA